MSKYIVVEFSLAVYTVTAVFLRVNYCEKCEEGGPSTGSRFQ